MLWQCKWGHRLEDFERDADKGLVAPSYTRYLELMDESGQDVLVYYNEFQKLSTNRSIDGFSGGVGPIKYMDIFAYLMLGLCPVGDSVEDFVFVITHVDHEYVNYRAEEANKKSNSGSVGSSPDSLKRFSSKKPLRKPKR